MPPLCIVHPASALQPDTMLPLCVVQLTFVLQPAPGCLSALAACFSIAATAALYTSGDGTRALCSGHPQASERGPAGRAVVRAEQRSPWLAVGASRVEVKPDALFRLRFLRDFCHEASL